MLGSRERRRLAHRCPQSTAARSPPPPAAHRRLQPTPARGPPPHVQADEKDQTRLCCAGVRALISASTGGSNEVIAKKPKPGLQ